MTTVAKEKIEISSVLPKDKRIYATGRRKTATARVWIAKGSGKIVVNGKQDRY